MDFISWLSGWWDYLYGRLGTDGLLLVGAGVLLSFLLGKVRKNLLIIVVIVIAVFVASYYYGFSLPQPSDVVSQLPTPSSLNNTNLTGLH